MGVSHYNRYQATNHAKKRYRERITKQTNELDMLKDFRRLMQQARFLDKEHNRECWLHEERNVVLILDPEKYLIVTIYNSVEQYDRIGNDADVEDTDSDNQEERTKSELHPKVSAMLSRFSKQEHDKQEREYFARLAPMYKEYGDRIGKLAYTNMEHFDGKRAELNELQVEISKLVSEKNKVLKDLQLFIE